MSAHNLLEVNGLLLNLHLQFLLLLIHLIVEISELLWIYLQSLTTILLAQKIHILIVLVHVLLSQ